MSEQTPLLAGEKLAKMHDLLRQCGYDFNEVHPECYRNFSYVKLYELLHNTRPPSQPGRVATREQIARIIDPNFESDFEEYCDMKGIEGEEKAERWERWLSAPRHLAALAKADAILPHQGNGAGAGGRPLLQEHTSADFAACEDCPPLSYPTDKTRCTSCPRRALSRNSTDE